MALIVQLIAALAWPAAAVVIAVLFRKPINQLIGNITKFKVGALEGEVRQELKQLPAGSDQKQLPIGTAERSNGDTALATTEVKQLPAGGELQRVDDQEVIDYAPSGAVVQSWAKLEDAMTYAANLLGLADGTTRRPQNAMSIAKRLLQAEAIDASTFQSISTLRALRNRVVHSWSEAQQLSSAVAADFSRTTAHVESLVRLGARRVRAQLLLRALDARSAADVSVWPLALVGIGDQQQSQEMAILRVGRWGAKCGAGLLEVSREDAQLLVEAGATELRANSAGDHKLAQRALDSAKAADPA